MRTTVQPLAFSAALRSRTLDDHQRAEQQPFIVDLMGGALGLDAYAALLAQLAVVYAALEDCERAAALEPTVAPFVSAGLHRREALAADLAALRALGHDAAGVPILPATRRYAARITHIAATWPVGFVAHHYTRYLGDLSGGQVIRRMLERHYALDASALTFYDFEGLPSPVAFKVGYRDALDAAPWSDSDRERLIDEVALAYRLNGAVFAELAVRERIHA